LVSTVYQQFKIVAGKVIGSLLRVPQLGNERSGRPGEPALHPFEQICRPKIWKIRSRNSEGLK
jgi:hypothetical protein